MTARASAELASIEDPDLGVVATLWVRLQPTEPGAGTARRAVAGGRDHPEALVARRLTVGDMSWRIVSVERPGGGRMTLRLEL